MEPTETKSTRSPLAASRNCAVALSTLLISSFGLHQANADPLAMQQTTTPVESATAAPVGLREGSVIVVPIPQSNPTIGSGLSLLGGYLFQLDKESSTSFVGIAGMGTDNGTRVAGAAASLSFGQGRWNVLVAYANAELNYDLYRIGSLNLGGLPITQEGDIAKLKLTYGLTKTWKAGVDGLYMRTAIGSPKVEQLVAPYFPGLGIDIEDVLFGPVLAYDSVDDNIYPTSGLSSTLTAQAGRTMSGYTRDYSKAVLDTKGYSPLASETVLAGRITVCSAEKGTPFYNLCALGLTDGFRGYAIGEYLDNALASAQIEVRQRLTGRFGVTAFGGAGLVGDELGSLSDTDPALAGGIGLRFRISKKFPLDLSIDQAINVDGEQTTYLYVGQAF